MEKENKKKERKAIERERKLGGFRSRSSLQFPTASRQIELGKGKRIEGQWKVKRSQAHHLVVVRSSVDPLFNT